MSSHNCHLVEESLVLLREVRAGLHNESNRDLVAALDRSIVMLEVALSQGPSGVGHVGEALKVLGQGLAVLPALQRLVEMLKD